MKFELDSSNEDACADVRAKLSEHFNVFCFIVMNEDGDIYYDYSNPTIGKMLMQNAQEDLEDVQWEWYEEEEEEN